MSNDADQVVVGANGRVLVAPVGTPAPDDSTSALDAAFFDVGFISEDGATFSEGKDITDIRAWQSFHPIRKIVTDRNVAASFVMREWSRTTVELALGGQVSDNGSGEYIYEPPDPQDLDERSLILEWEDGDKNYRLYFPKGITAENVETELMRTAAADLPVTFAGVDPGDGTKIYTLFTNDPAFAAGS